MDPSSSAAIRAPPGLRELGGGAQSSTSSPRVIFSCESRGRHFDDARKKASFRMLHLVHPCVFFFAQKYWSFFFFFVVELASGAEQNGESLPYGGEVGNARRRRAGFAQPGLFEARSLP